MKSFSEWARQQHGSEASGAPFSAADALIAALMADLERSIALDEDVRNWQQIAELRQRWKNQTENAQARALRGKIAEIEAKLASSVEAALVPLLEEAVVKKGIEDFCGVLQRHLQAASAQGLTIKAPAGWRLLLDDGLQVSGIVACVEEQPSGEISATVADTEIETDIGAWIGRLRQEAA